MLTRLEILCYIHGYQGGTIHQYNRAYNTDFIRMNQDDFKTWAYKLSIRSNRRIVQ